MCRWCRSKESTWRCDDCSGFPEGCEECFSEAHKFQPFHNVRSWTGTYYEPSFLFRAGLFIHLGHGGSPCPAPRLKKKEKNTSQKPERLSFQIGMAKAFTREYLHHDLHHTYLTVVDCNGLHQVLVDWCRCKDREDEEVQLLKFGLCPATPSAPRTAFTFRVLDDFLLQNRECKVPAMSYFAQLQRKTLDIAPHEVPGRYKELLRCARQWRLIKALRAHGHSLGGTTEAAEGGTTTTAEGGQDLHLSQGDLATSCPACPRPGINMSEGWENDPAWWKHSVTLCMDGNFKADHLKMRKEETDVSLTDGSGFMTESSAYEAHLKTQSNQKEISTCNAHRAVTQANESRGLHKDVTGIAAVACGRHGFFVPGTIVNFQKGERFCNIDWALYMALLWFTGIAQVFVLYDIWCVYGKKLWDRFRSSSTLKMPKDVVITGGIGQFHVHGHKDNCFARFSPAFLLGAGWVDGEILETLWSALNEISRSTRSMTTSHRREVLDDHMDDSNWKKLVRLAMSLVEKWRRALVEYDISVEVLGGLSEVAGVEQVQKWTSELEEAQKERLTNEKAMDLLTIQDDDAPSQASIQAKLAGQAPGQTESMTDIEWVADGIDIEVQQMQVAELVRDAETHGTAAAQKARDARRALETRLTFWLRQARVFMGSLLDATPDRKELQEHLQRAAKPRPPPMSNPISLTDIGDSPEQFVLPLPSAYGAAACARHQVADLAKYEGELRAGQMNDALNEVKLDIARKAMMYGNEIRAAKGSQAAQTRARARVARVEDDLDRHANIYRKGWEAAISLSCLNAKYEELLSSHLKASAAELNPATRGTRNSRLPWLWRTQLERGGGPDIADTYFMTVQRITWMREKCRLDRWREEIEIVGEEMERVPRYFRTRAQEWANRVGSSSVGTGYKVWARSQEAMWGNLARMADIAFKGRPPAPVHMSIQEGNTFSL
ncbi:hypothetical protein CONPUDRAFT_49507 [Coniophora puteana RWD-64-598 SS2]|uniref:CxC2-like cysteine cluster KDZ transposase-associated domain-containing protein n=1 Tax=Coniophora puteana (strain RWD-64-598) TaxID=741705 RepID=A0A5M3MXK9_CONPW|nr:uncharacterized protein CONPUDRAFT_49507 [Coniophora puteana RWD-64-598 SS2]EIW83832.1 hypothetical protein CONPUDRAFT_49507 [Coniophora puteana RWD-64-598 SS2]